MVSRPEAHSGPHIGTQGANTDMMPVTQEADEVGTAGVEDDDFVRTGRRGLRDDLFREDEVGERDDVGGQRRRNRRKEEAHLGEADSEDGEVLHHEAEAERGESPLDLGHRNFTQQDGRQDDREELCRDDALVTNQPPEVRGPCLALEGGVEQEQVGQQAGDRDRPGGCGHTGGRR